MRLSTDLMPSAAVRTTVRDWLLGCAIGLALLIAGGLWSDPHEEPVPAAPLLSAAECEAGAGTRWPVAMPVKASTAAGSACVQVAAGALRP